MPTLLERLRAAREIWTPVGPHELLIRRPTALQVARLANEGDRALLEQCVVGWRNITEADLVPGGDGVTPPFDVRLCLEWLEDKPDLYSALVEAVSKMIRDRVEAIAASEKK